MAVELGAGSDRCEVGSDASGSNDDSRLATARLDHLGGAKQIAQIGGTIGREFSLALLQAVLANASSPFTARDLPAQLAALIRSGMLIGSSEGDGIRHTFKHALVRDAAYRSLLERDRILLHRVIANVVSEQFANLPKASPSYWPFTLLRPALIPTPRVTGKTRRGRPLRVQRMLRQSTM